MIAFIKRLLRRFFKPKAIPKPPEPPPPVYQLTASDSWAARHIGEPFKVPLFKMPPGYFWKKDARGSVWRIYRIPMNHRYYDNLKVKP